MVLSKSSERILAYIRDERLKAGDRMPAEVELAKILGFSRNSVREAYSDLTARGVMVRRHGIGTFIARPDIKNEYRNFVGFWRVIEAAGRKPALQILGHTTTQAGDDLGAMVTDGSGRRLNKLEWLFLADGRPVVYIEHVIAPLVRLDGIDWSKARNINSVLADQIVLAGAELEIRTTAVTATGRPAELLKVTEGTALLQGTARVRSGDGTIPIASRNWSNPEFLSVVQRRSIVEEPSSSASADEFVVHSTSFEKGLIQ